MKSFSIRPSQKKHIFKYTLIGLIMIIVAILPFWVETHRTIATYISIGLIFVCVLNLLYTYWFTRLYLITVKETGIQFSYGVFYRTTETIEMHRIIDFIKYQDFDDLIFQLASLTVISTDKTTPEKKFKGLHEHDAKRVLNFLQLYASDSLVKHLNKLDEVPTNPQYDYAIQKVSQSQKPQAKEL